MIGYVYHQKKRKLPKKEIYKKANELKIIAYNNSNDKENFFRSGFHRLAGTKNLEHQIKNGISVKKIKETWKNDLIKFKKIREKYLIYN